MILDFSRVGYRWGDAEIPTVAVVATLTPPADGADATNLIQSAIDKTVAGAIVLKKGVYNISGTIRIGKSGIVLRGEGDTETDGHGARGHRRRAARSDRHQRHGTT